MPGRGRSLSPREKTQTSRTSHRLLISGWKQKHTFHPPKALDSFSLRAPSSNLSAIYYCHQSVCHPRLGMGLRSTVLQCSQLDSDWSAHVRSFWARHFQPTQATQRRRRRLKIRTLTDWMLLPVCQSGSWHSFPSAFGMEFPASFLSNRNQWFSNFVWVQYYISKFSVLYQESSFL